MKMIKTNQNVKYVTNDTNKMYGKHQNTITCKNKVLLEGTQKEHYYEKNHIEETHKKYYESAKCQYCPTNADTNEEV